MNSRFTVLRKPLLACAIAFVSLSAFSAPPQMDLRVDNPSFDKEAAQAERTAVHNWLLSERLPAAGRNPFLAQASDEQVAAVDNAPRQDPEIVGLDQDVSFDVSFRNVRMSQLRRGTQLEYGAIQGTADGGYVYSAEIASPGAVALRVKFAGVSLPEGAELYVFNEEGQFAGPYTGRGPLGSGQFQANTLAGDSLTIQLRQVGTTDAGSLRSTRFQVVGLGHIRPRFMAATCGYNESCVEDAACTSSSVVIDAEKAVALMLFVSGAYYYICSGGLINNAGSSTAGSASVPLFLTANHCISKGREANTLETFFDHRNPSCGNKSACSFPSSENTIGSSIVSTGRAQDYTLLQLASTPTGTRAYLGWNATPVHNSTQMLYRLSHPAGAPQSYSEHRVDPDVGTCTSWPRGDRIYSRDIVGATEGGSSGSPVLNAGGQIVGQLSGACGFAPSDSCQNNPGEANATVDGAFAAYYSTVAPFLNGSSCTPSTEICDGLDNDCDGQVDEGLSCGGGTGETGDSCTNDSDCASNQCTKGRPSTRVCL